MPPEVVEQQSSTPIPPPAAAPPAAAPAPATEVATYADSSIVNPDPDSNLKDLSFLVDESDLPPAGMRGPQSRFQLPTPDAGKAPVTTGQQQQPASPQAATQQPAPQQQPQPAETAEQRAERLFAGKYKTAEELENGYQESQRMAHQKAQELAEMQQKFGSSDPRVIQQALALQNWYNTSYLPWAAQQNYLAAQARQGQPQQAQDTAPQEERPKPFLEMSRDEQIDMLSEDPKTAFMQGVADVIRQNPQILQEAIKANPQIVEQALPEVGAQRAADKILGEYNALEAAHPDAESILPMMTEIYKQDPRFKQAPMEVVYWIAKGVLHDQVVANQQQAIQSAAQIATQQAYDLQRQKINGAVDGAQSIEPGIGATADDLEQFLEWNKSRIVKVV